MVERLLELIVILAPLSLVSIGGANTVLPEVYRQVVLVRGWLSEAEFADLFAIARAAPGPNVLLYSLVGWKAAGWLGLLVATLAMNGPTSVLAYATAHAFQRFHDARWRRPLQAGLVPVSIGLMFAGGATLVAAADNTPFAYAISAGAIAVVLWTKVHPLAILAVAAVLGLTGWV